MKKFFYVCISVVCAMFLLCACADSETLNTVSEKVIPSTSAENSTSALDIRETIYEQLPAGKQALVSSDWDEAKVSTIVLNQGMGCDIESDYIDQEVYVLDFPHKDSINNLLVYASMDHEQIVGYGFTD
jgi:hypothetical protein